MQYLSSENPIHKIPHDLKRRLSHAQTNGFAEQFGSTRMLCGRVFADLRITVPLDDFGDMPPSEFADQPFDDLCVFFSGLMRRGGMPPHAVSPYSRSCAQRVHLIRAFDNPDSVIEMVASRVAAVVRKFPRKAEDIERGRNPGDIIDPYILAAAENLVCGGDFGKTIEAAVSHKAFMIIEGLMGHLHEDVIGRMRGNVRAPEPRREALDPLTNPFPGADVVQPPTKPGDKIRFHQIKSKTGSAKGGDGRRLGQQLKTLQDFYDAEVFYNALLGNTLTGHRSRKAVESAAPGVVVLVGDAAFGALTGSKIGPYLLLRVYQAAFETVASETGYEISRMTKGIVQSFKDDSTALGQDYLQGILRRVTRGEPTDQDSRIASPRRRRTYR